MSAPAGRRDPIDVAIDEHVAFVEGWTDLDKRIVAGDFLNWQFGMSETARAMIEAERAERSK